jgi:small GTP-binding protein
MTGIEMKTPSKGLAELFEQFAKQKTEYEKTKIKCGFVGRSGVGKSSLINAITGQKLAPVGAAKETTVEAHEYAHRGIVLVDLPGCGTERFPTGDYVSRLKLESYDFFVFVTDLRFFQDDKTVYLRLVTELKKPCYLVRNKFDQALHDSGHDGRTTTEAELKAEIEHNIRENLASHNIAKIYMVSARRPALYDLSDLLDDIKGAFSGMKRLRLETDMAAWSKQALERKRDDAMRITSWYAAAAAINGLNPVPGFDLAVDLKVLQQLSREVGGIYSLTPEQEEYWRGLLKGPHGGALLKKAVDLTVRYGSEMAITAVLKSIGKEEASKAFAKCVPLIGQVLACGTGFVLTYKFGMDLVGDFHGTAEKMIEELSSPSDET